MDNVMRSKDNFIPKLNNDKSSNKTTIGTRSMNAKCTLIPKCNQGHDMKINDVNGTVEELGQHFDDGDGYQDYTCDKCKIEYYHLKDYHPMVKRWVCRHCGTDYCFNCNPRIT